MELSINEFLRRLNIHFPWIYKFIKFIKTILAEEYNMSELLFKTDKSLCLNKWVFHDENWVRVIHRFEHRRRLAEGLRLNVVDNQQEFTEEVLFLEDGTIKFDGKTETNDEWIYLFLDPAKYQWDNYSWKFSIRRNTHFKEFQFGFRYQDFYNRYRYRLQDNHIYFDKVVNGKFYNAFGSAPFHMDLGGWYDVIIDVYKNNFKFYVNEVLIMNDFDFVKNFTAGSIAIILWENNGVTNIKASVGPMSVHRLVSKKPKG